MDKADQLARSIADNLRKLRSQQKLSMADLAAKSSVSKAMISKIERQDGGVSTEILARLSEALGVRINDLLAEDHPKDVFLHKYQDQPQINDPDHGFTRRALSPVFPNRGLDFVYNSLAPHHKTPVFPAHKSGVHEYIHVLQGCLTARLDEEIFLVSAGDCLFFDAHRAHQFINETETEVIWYLIIDNSLSRF